MHRRAWGWALLAGGLHAMALSPWVASWHAVAPALLQSLALLLLLWQMRSPVTPLTARQTAGLTWLYGSVWLVGATGWMYVSLHDFGGLPSWMAAAAVGALCVALALYMALLGWAWARWRHGLWWRDALSFAGLWFLAEWARAVIFTGFPWGASGYALIGTPLDHLAPYVGVYGMGAVWAGLLAASLWWTMAGRGRRVWPRVGPAVGALASVLALLSLLPAGRFTREHGPALTATLLQGNVPQDEKFIAERQGPTLRWHLQQLVESPGDLVVAPETAIPLLPSQLPESFWDAVEVAYPPGQGRQALVGLPLGSFQEGYTNSVMGLGGATPYRYNKHHLVPFGEFIPMGFHWFVQMMNMPLGDFSRGPLVAPSLEVKGQRVAPTICYEDLFGEEIAARFVDEAQAPTILANVSNLAWFGREVAIHQHLQIARMRSLEFELPTLRATNTGPTVLIDHHGRVQAALATHTRGRLTVEVQGRVGVTPYAAWAGRWGLWPAWLLAWGLFWLGRRQWGH